MIGDSVKYEASFITDPVDKQAVDLYNASTSKVSMAGGKKLSNFIF
jgi:hypothetical protein